MTNTNQDKEKIRQELMDFGYKENEINQVINWLDDIENGKTYTAQELYQKLFNKKKVYA